MSEASAQLSIVEELRALERKRVDALVQGNVAVLGPLLAEDLTYTHSTGLIETKAEFLRRLGAGERRYDSMEHEPGVLVRTYGDTAILSGVTRVTVVAQGELPSLHLRFTEVWVRRAGQWQVAAWHATRLTE